MSAPAPASASAIEERNIRNLVGQTACAGVVEGGISTYLPVMLVRMGGGPATVAALSSGLALVTLAAALPAGPFVARQRELVIWSSRYLLAIRVLFAIIVLAAFLPTNWAIAAIVVLWALTGIPAAIVNNAFYEVLAESINPRRLSAVNGFRWALLGVVAAVCVGAFGFVLDQMPFPGGYQAVFLVSALGGVLGVWFYARITIPPRVPRPDLERPRLAERLRGALVPRDAGGDYYRFALASAAVRLGLHLPLGLYSVFWINELGATDTWIGLRSTLANGILPVGYVVWGRLAGRIDHRWTLTLAAVGYALYPLITAASPSVEWLLPAALAWGFFVAGIDFGLVEGLLKVSPADRRPELVATNTFQANAIAFSAPLLGAWLAEIVGIRPVLIFSAGLLVAVALLAVYLSSKASTAPSAASA